MIAAGLLALLQFAAPPPPPPPRKPHELVVCADPNNMPFSNQAGAGFENRIAALIAKDLGDSIRYVWWAQRRGYARNTINGGQCDIWPGVASGVEMIATTRPYYRSSYMFVTRANKPLASLTLDDPRLKTLRVGVQMVGNDAMNTPPAHAMASRGLTSNVRGFMLYGDYSQTDPAAAIIAAVGDGSIDVALAWGPLAGWFAKQSKVPLRLERVTPWLDAAQWPMVYDISVGVRKDDPELERSIEAILDRQAPAIAAILDAFGIPRIPEE